VAIVSEDPPGLTSAGDARDFISTVNRVLPRAGLVNFEGTLRRKAITTYQLESRILHLQCERDGLHRPVLRAACKAL
jgi:hypothetical protein